MQEDDVLSEIKEMMNPPQPAGTTTPAKKTVTRTKAPVRKAA
jgi:hypothetical protein